MSRNSLEIYRQLVQKIREEAFADMIANLKSGAVVPALSRSVRRDFREEEKKAPVVRVTNGAPKIAQPANGFRRTKAELDVVTEQLHAHLLKHPGAKMREITTALGVHRFALREPLRNLIKQKRVTMKGTRSTARYTAK